MADVSLSRLYVLRATYLIIVVGLGVDIWPSILGHEGPWKLAGSVVVSLLGGVTLIASLGIRYPLKMIPLLLFELVWKSIWLLAVALQQWRLGPLDAGMLESVKACLMGIVILPLVIAWRSVVTEFVRARGDRWTLSVQPATPPAGALIA